jgi:hypothetical protein
MALLDVSELLFDPDLCDLVTVTRRTNVVSTDTGRNTVTTVPYTGVVMFVLISDPSDEQRSPESTNIPRSIEVVTNFRLRGPSEGVLADVITYMGSDYTLTEIKPHTKWGAGFVKAKATSMNASDPSPT